MATDVLGKMKCEMLPLALSLLWAVTQSAFSPTVNGPVRSRVVWRSLGRNGLHTLEGTVKGSSSLAWGATMRLTFLLT